jgi:hypothetical protein
MPICNKPEVIALTYDDLHGVGRLRHAREIAAESLCSQDRALRTVFQAVEVALLNLTDLTTRIISDLASGNISTAVVKSAWIASFHRVVDCLSHIPLRLPRPVAARREGSVTISVGASSAFQAYFAAARELDAALLDHCSRTEHLEAVLAERSFDEPLFRLLHNARVAMATAACWERRLAGLHVESEPSSIDVWIAGDELREAVFDKRLPGDTFLTQFRGLHQIPEILALEVNACLRETVPALRSHNWFLAANQLVAANELAEGIGASIMPIVDCLAVSDYHRIRGSLGLTSGSQSTALRKELFGEIYEQLASELRNIVFGSGDACDPQMACAFGMDEADAPWAIQSLVNGLLRLRAQIESWREHHQLLPQHNLGGDHTKSLIGSSDAVEAVAHMKSRAEERDAAVVFLAGRQELPVRDLGAFIAYIESPRSLNSQLLEATGRITRRRFVDVQERRGFFNRGCSFSRPSDEDVGPPQRIE